MFKNTFQSGFLSILYSIGSKPLQIWDKKVSHLLKDLESSSIVVLLAHPSHFALFLILLPSFLRSSR